MMLHKKLIVSTDSGSYLGPIISRKIWSFLSDDPNFLGFEMIGWHWSPLFLKANQAGQKPVLGIHGRIGKNEIDRLIVSFLNLMLMSTKKLLSLSPSLSYILIHEAEYHTLKTQQLIEVNKEKINCLFIENNSPKEKIDLPGQAVEELLSKGVKAGLVFDLVHYIGANLPDEEFNQNWQEAMEYFDQLGKKAQEENFPLRIHLPVGTGKMDSLPMERMTDEQWRELKAVLDKYQILVVIETLPNFIQALLPFLFISKLQKRYQILLEKLTTLKVL